MDFKHESVLLNECIENLKIKSDGIYVDGTLGGAGHSKHILEKLDDGLLIGIDQDEDALKAADDVLKKINSNYKLVHSNFSDVINVLDDLGIDKIDGILLDLGVSSYQIDNPERGFSYMKDGDLDMRMDQSQSLTARKVVNEYSYDKLIDIFFKFGEEKFSKRIARHIVEKRAEKEITTTIELVDIIKGSLPGSELHKDSHPAKRVFQAIRIEVNNELGIIEDTIFNVIKRMNKGGRVVIITFHSLEDRIVKHAFKELYIDCVCPPGMPICTCGKKREIKIITKKPIYPTEDELNVNSRSRSAKLRVAEKI
ncbi:16S rRNA (cytosine(1402)-N(4))-methyltransferase RsmH [Clostridiaceae bacterium HSG29]|nr:16S rRNA (cytosine(1402)-N(4))-methyltransferase RsmH [Clostridiaceae bacterium HSG29]